MICNTQGTHYEKALHLFLEHSSCFQLAMENLKKKKIKLLNDNPSHGTITYGTLNHRQTTLHKATFMIFKLGS